MAAEQWPRPPRKLRCCASSQPCQPEARLNHFTCSVASSSENPWSRESLHAQRMGWGCLFGPEESTEGVWGLDSIAQPFPSLTRNLQAPSTLSCQGWQPAFIPRLLVFRFPSSTSEPPTHHKWNFLWLNGTILFTQLEVRCGRTETSGGFALAWRVLGGLFLNIYLAAPGLTWASETFSCSTWDLVPWPGIKLGSPALGTQSLSHWTITEVPELRFWCKQPGVLPCSLPSSPSCLPFFLPSSCLSFLRFKEKGRTTACSLSKLQGSPYPTRATCFWVSWAWNT